MSYNIFERDKYIFSSVNKIRVIKEQTTISKQVFLYIKELKLYGINLKSLVNLDLKDSMKNLSLNLACYLAENNELLERFKEKREIPYTNLSRETKVNRITIENLSRYIIAYALMISNPNFKEIREYINIDLKQDNSALELKDIVSRDKNYIHRGIVLKNYKTYSIVIKSNGDFIKLKRNQDELNLGKELAGRQKRGFKNYKKSIFIITSIIVIVAMFLLYQYKNLKSTVKIQTTSVISLDVNSFDKIIKVSSETKKGKLMLSSINSENKSISEGIIDVLEYAKENSMIIDNGNGMNIIVTGKQLSDKALQQAEEFIRYEELKVNINNCGDVRKIKPLTLEEKKAKKEKQKIIKQNKEDIDKIKTVDEQKIEKN